MSLVIAGGGLAGAAAACLLARGGRDVTVLERSTGASHKICGEFLSIEAQHYLRGLGLDLDGLGGHVITDIRLVRNTSVVTSKLPFHGLGLTRHALDEALLRHAAASGAIVRRGETCNSTDGVTFLATGKHDLREARRNAAPPEDLVGFKMYFRLAHDQHTAICHAVEVVLFADGYAGLQIVEGARANLCLLVHRDRLARAGGTWDGLLADLLATSPHLGTRLRDATALLERPLTIARVPYGFIHTPKQEDRFYRLGDQACVIPSFSGDGMALTLHSAMLASRCFLAGQSPFAYHTALARDVAGPIRRAALLYRWGHAEPGQTLLLRMAQLWPGLLRHAAHHTRIPSRALLNAA